MKFIIAIQGRASNTPFCVVVPDLPGCTTSGGKLYEVMASAREVIAQRLEFMANAGEVIPAPLPVNVHEANPEYEGWDFAEVDVPFTGPRPSVLLERNREEIRSIVAANRCINPRVFGPVVHGEDVPGGGVELLVDTGEGVTYFDLGAISTELEKIFGVDINVTTSGALKGRYRDEVLAEAQPV